MIRLFSEQDDKYCKRFYPIIGTRKPKYHPSLMDLTGKTRQQVADHCFKDLGLRIDRSINTTDNTKWCTDCVELKPLNEFLKKRNTCLDCRRRTQKEKEKDIDFLLLKRYRVRLMREDNWESLEKAKKTLHKIINNIGYPEKCFFNDQFCNTNNDPRKLQFGHINSHTRGGSLADPKNVIWICSRHNWMMADSNLEELYNMSRSWLANYDR